jgi:ABC-type nitrate/sulfonate/bicarbonate transport system permease component
LQSRETLDTDLIIVIMILIGVIGYVSDYLMLLLTRKAMHA